MFAQLDQELHFGYQKNGSLVLATSDDEIKVLHELKARGDQNGVRNLRVLNKAELFELEPYINSQCTGALLAPDAGNLIPYEFAIAMAENAVDNGVELRIRREVQAISKGADGMFEVSAKHWEPKDYLDNGGSSAGKKGLPLPLQVVGAAIFLILGNIAHTLSLESDSQELTEARQTASITAGAVAILLALAILPALVAYFGGKSSSVSYDPTAKASDPVGGGGRKVSVAEMMTGGSGTRSAVDGVVVNGGETFKARYVVNAAGGGSDKISAMIGDDSFQIKPRLGDYLLLHRDQGYLSTHTLFPCPDPVLGKGVLVQTTLWGNLILGPTARDTYKKEMAEMSADEIQTYILGKCSNLVPAFDPKKVIHGFCGARAKNSTGDWVIGHSKVDANFIQAAGIDSPGLAGSPAIAVEVVRLLGESGLILEVDPSFNPNRAPIITPKDGFKGLSMKPKDKAVSDMKKNVVCKCEKVTELEVVTALHRSLPIDSTQAIRKRTRAGMGHCQGEVENYDCECRVAEIIARENKMPVKAVGRRPWPATTTLPERWISDDFKGKLETLMRA